MVKITKTNKNRIRPCGKCGKLCTGRRCRECYLLKGARLSVRARIRKRIINNSIIEFKKDMIVIKAGLPITEK